MLSNEEYVRQSLELNLFFLRIMKEHAIFLEASFTPKDMKSAQIADAFKVKLQSLLSNVISLSNGNVSNDVLNSGEVVTKYTLQAERVTENLSGIKIDSNLTKREEALRGSNNIRYQPTMIQQVNKLNQDIITTVSNLIKFKEKIYNDVTTCRMFTTNYPLMIHHITEEAKHYVSALKDLQNRKELDMASNLIAQEKFWDDIMMEHAEFIRGLLDPSEKQLYKLADNFAKEYEAIKKEMSVINNNKNYLPKITDDTVKVTTELRNFKIQGAEGILNCKVKSIIIPLLADHVLREANHYLRILQTYTPKLKPMEVAVDENIYPHTNKNDVLERLFAGIINNNI